MAPDLNIDLRKDLAKLANRLKPSSLLGWKRCCSAQNVPAAHLNVPAAHLNVPAAHLNVPAAHLNVPAAHEEVITAYIKRNYPSFNLPALIKAQLITVKTYQLPIISDAVICPVF